MLQLFAMLDFGIVVKMGPCGFIPVGLSIFCPYLGTPVPLSKLPRWKWFQSLCTRTFAWLKWTMVVGIVGSVKFTVLVLMGSWYPSSILQALLFKYLATRYDPVVQYLPYALDMEILYNKCWRCLRSDYVRRIILYDLYPLPRPFTSIVGGGGQ